MNLLNNVTVNIQSFVFLVILATVLTHTKGHLLEFSIEPSDTVVENGQSAVLDCVIKESQHQPSVLIQWLDRDKQILTFSGDSFRSQLTNGSLYINSVSEEQGLTGSYRCMANLPNVGSIVSRSAKLSVASLSGFQEEPRDITVFAGQKAYFACRVQSLPIPKIKWLKDERPFHLDDLRMTILPSGALEIDEVLESDQGAYRCNASSLNSYKLSSKAILRVDTDRNKAIQTAAPTFIAKPHRQVVVEGQDVSLDCAANGYPKPMITWLKNGIPIDMNDLDSRYSLVGSTSSLKITNIKESDAGTYQCRAQNREDSEDASATIEIQVPPRFLIKPIDIIEVETKDIQLNCSVHGKPVPKVEWLKNGEPIVPSEYYQIVNGHDLKIMGLILNDSGLIQCVASNSAGNVQTSASVKVLKAEYKKNKKGNPKKTTTRIVNDKLLKNQSFTLFSSLKSEKNAKFSDVDFSHLYLKTNQNSNSNNNNNNNNMKNFNPLSAFSSLKSSDSNDSVFDIEQIQGNFPSYPKPPVSGLNDKQGEENLEIGSPQDLNAPVIKARFVILSWKTPTLNHENIEGYSVYYRQEGSERERCQNTSRSKLEEMSISGLIPGRVYHFRVVPFNSKSIGKTSESLVVTTQAEENVPSQPLQFEAYATGSKSIHVNWKPPKNPIGLIEKYTVYYMETKSSVEHHINTIELQYDFINLGIFTEYSIWVVAVNQNGPGAATEEKLVRTFSDIPSEPPFNITTEAASTSLTVRWQPPSLEYQNGIITGYKIRIRKSGSRKAHTYTTSANERMYVFNDLEKETPYQIKLWAINVNGTGPSTEWHNAETYENILDESKVPDRPGPLNVRPFSDRVFVSWTPPKSQDIKIRNYILSWGKGVPDQFLQELDEKTRSYMIERLEPNSEYVISIRASNQIGAGAPAYANVRTQDEPPPEPQQPLIPPIGLKAHVLSTTSVVLYWTDTTLSKTQMIKDNRYYVVKYAADKSLRTKHLNVTELNVMINDLKPNTLYEFSVKLVKGRKESPWSMVVTNTTWDTPPSAAPRDLDVHLLDNESQVVELTWQPPKTSGARITGYIIFYTDNATKSDREWSVLAIKGDKHSSTIPDLKPFTEYFFKIQGRNIRGYGPFSSVVSFRTGYVNIGGLHSSKGQNLDAQSIFSGDMLLYMIIAGCVVAVTTISVVAAFLCCRRKEQTTSPDRSKKGYQKGNLNIKPPDLWIHHDQMELKNLEKSHSCNDAASSSGALTLPRSVAGNEYDNHDSIHTSTLEKRNYPSYVAIATSINNGGMGPSSADSTPSSRPSYPRTQYSMPRAHVTVDGGHPNIALMESPYATHPSNLPIGYETSSSYISQSPSVAHVPTGSGYAPGMNALAESQGGKRLQGQGHPLKSFTVPAPPPITSSGTNQAKHIVSQPQVTIRPNCSPFKKHPNPSQVGSLTPSSRISNSNPPPHSVEEIQRLQPSHSTEELNQEMANLEGLMLTLNAITANEFEC